MYIWNQRSAYNTNKHTHTKKGSRWRNEMTLYKRNTEKKTLTWSATIHFMCNDSLGVQWFIGYTMNHLMCNKSSFAMSHWTQQWQYLVSSEHLVGMSAVNKNSNRLETTHNTDNTEENPKQQSGNSPRIYCFQHRPSLFSHKKHYNLNISISSTTPPPQKKLRKFRISWFQNILWGADGFPAKDFIHPK